MCVDERLAVGLCAEVAAVYATLKCCSGKGLPLTPIWLARFAGIFSCATLHEVLRACVGERLAVGLDADVAGLYARP